MKKAKKGSEEALTRNVGIKLSDQDRENLTRLANEAELTITKFIRNAITEKIKGVELSEKIQGLIKDGIHQINETARNNKTNQEILNLVNNLIEKVSLKSDFDEHKNEVLANIESLNNQFIEMGSSYTKLINYSKESTKTRESKEKEELNEIKKNQFLSEFLIGKMIEKLQIPINKEELSAAINMKISK